jgi:hypothetical protein
MVLPAIIPSPAQRLRANSMECEWLLNAEKRNGRRRSLPKARSLPFAWDFGTSRWQL